MDEDDIIIIDEGLEPDEDTDPEEEYDDSSDLSEYEDSVYTDDVILALFESTDEEDTEDEDTENNDLEDDISLNDAESDELNYYDNVPIDEYDSENNEDDDSEDDEEESEDDEEESEDDSEDDSEDEEESDESDYIINDNIATVPTIANVSAGDRVMVVLKNGEPTVVGSAGSGDIFSENLEETVSRLGDIEVDNLEVKGRLTAAEGNITTLTSSKADITDLTAATARIGTLETETTNVKGRLTAAEGSITTLTSSKADITDLTAAIARIGDLEADHVSVSAFEAEQANIDQLQADTADIDEIRANSAKVENLTAAQLEADHATVGSLNTTYATIANLDAATGRISDLESTRVRTTDLEANYITADAIEAAYTKTDLSNTDVAWIQNGTIKNGAITNAMINSVSANKLTAGTIDASVINVTNLQADDISVTRINGQTVSGKTLVDALEQHEDDISDLDTKIDTQVEALNDRIDGAIETFTGTAVPTLSNSPASSWNTTKLKDQHVGDVYYVVNENSQQNGYCYRFTKSGSSYSWQLIKDSDVTAALGRLQTAEGKISTIEQFDSDISSWKIDTDEEIASIKSNHTTLAGRVTTAEGELETKVDQTTFNTLEQTVGTNSSSITSLTTATTQLRTDFDNIEIGGRNLLRGTADPHLNSEILAARAAAIGDGIIRITPTSSTAYIATRSRYLDFSYFEAGEYTLSFDAKFADVETTYTKKSLAAYVGYSSASTWNVAFRTNANHIYKGGSHGASLTNDWQRFSMTINLLDAPYSGTLVPTDGCSLRVEFYVTESSIPVDIRLIKLEKGNRSTAWSPAPEDVERKPNILRGTNQLIELLPFEERDNPNWSEGLWGISSGNATNGDGEIVELNDCPDGQLYAFHVWSINSNNKDLLQRDIPLLPNVEYQVSYYVRLTPDIEQTNIRAEVRIYGYATESATGATALKTGYSSYLTSTEWVFTTFNFVLTDAMFENSNKIKNLLIGVNGAGDIQICGVKLEQSDYVTKWAPSPFDSISVQNVNKVSNKVSEITQTIDGITTRIGSVENTLTTKADGSTVESISSDLNDISETVAGHTQTISSINSTLSTKADGSTVSTLSSQVNDISDTVDGHTSQLTSITQTQTSIQGNAVKSTVQLWFTKANTSAPNKPTAHVTVNDVTAVNQWNLAVPNYNASYPNYYYCYEYEFLNGTYGWSAVTRDIATGEMQERARTAITNAAAADTKASNAATAAANAQADIDGLEIGGRNLLRKSSSISMGSANSKNVAVTVWGRENVAADDILTVSFDALTEDDGCWIDMYWRDPGTSYAGAAYFYPAFQLTNQLSHFEYSGEAKKVPAEYLRIATDNSKHGSAVNHPVTIYNLKLEKGNKATTWTPAPEDVDSDISTAQTAADTAQATADKNVKESIQLWITKAGSSAPAKPTSKVTSTAVSGNAWTTKVPTYDSTYPYYFYCMQYVAADGTVTWSNVVYDQATTEAQSVARAATTNLSTLQQDYATFKQTTQNFESTIGSTYATKVEATQMAQPNLAPFFTMDPTDVYHATTNPDGYWDANKAFMLGAEVIEQLADGWAHINFTNNGSGNTWLTIYEHCAWRHRAGDLKGSTKYTVMFEFRNVVKTGNVTCVGTSQHATAWPSMFIGVSDKGNVAVADGEQYHIGTTIEDPSSLTGSKCTTRTLITFPSGSSLNADFRISLYEGEYSGPYKPYSSDILYATQSDARSIESRVTSAETSITQNNEAIALKANASDVYTKTQTDGLISTEVSNRNSAIEQSAAAINLSVSQTYSTKTEATQMAQPNLAPLFSVDHSDVYNATTNPNGYWITSLATGGFTQLDNGWSHFEFNNTNGTAVKYSYIRPARVSDIVPGNPYTILLEIRNNNPTGTSTHDIYLQQIANNQFWGNVSGKTISGDLVTTTTMVDLLTCGASFIRRSYRLADVSHITSDSGIVFTYAIRTAVGGTNSFDIRMSLYEGIYDGPYKPYSGLKLYATNTNLEAAKASIKVTTDGITTEVEKKTDKSSIISTINQSAETVKIQASKVEIDGTAIFNSISSSVDNAITSKGYATTSQAQGYATTAKNEAISAAASDATSKANTAKSEAISAAASDATTKANAVQTNLDNLKIGGRNLLPYTTSLRYSQSGTNAGVTITYDGDGWFSVSGSPASGRTSGTFIGLWQNAAGNYASPVNDLVPQEGGVELAYSVETEGTPFVTGSDYASTTHVCFYGQSTGVSVRVGGFGSSDINKYVTAMPDFVSRVGYYVGQDADSSVTLNGRFRVKLENGNRVTDWTPAPEDQASDILASGVEYIEGTQTEATNLWTGVSKESALVVGKTISYRLPYAGTSTAATLELTLADGTTTGAKAIKQVYTTSSNTGALATVTTHWPVGSVIPMTYDGTQWIVQNYNTNVNQVDRVVHSNALMSASENATGKSYAVVASTIIGYISSLTGYQTIIGGSVVDISKPLLWGTGNVKTSTTFTNSYEVYLSCTLRNNKASWSGTTYETAYLFGTLNGQNLTVNTNVFTSTKPSTDDGNVYIPVGILYSAYQIAFRSSSDMYAYIDGKFQHVTPADIVSTHRIYYRTQTANASLAAPTTWVSEATNNVYNAWTTKVPPLATSTASGQTKYLYLYTCEQRKRIDGTIQCTKVLLDENTTVIDGGQIITNSITANQIAARTITATEIDATDLHVSAANVDGTLTIGKVNGLQDALDGKQASGDYATNSQAQGYATTVQTNLDNLEIGGRNLLRNTRTPVAANYAMTRSTITNGVITITPTTSAAYAKQKANYLDYDDYGTGIYTVSCDVRLSSAETTYTNKDFRIYSGFNTASRTGNAFSSSYDRYGIKIISDDDLTYDWKRVSATFDIPTDLTVGKTDALVSGSCLSVQLYVAASSIPVEVRFIKLERGSKPTDWTPAPEDAENDISEVQTLASTTSSNLTTEINQRKASYGTCDTAAATPAKAVTCSNFALYVGAQITVKFTYGNAIGQPTLNVNNTGAKAVEIMNNSQPTASMVKWPAYSNCTFTYDGTYWRFTSSDYDQTTATNYITADDTGISIHMSGNNTTYQRQTATGTTFYVNSKKRSTVGAEGLKVYIGDTAGSEVDVASFGETARIGTESGSHIEQTDTASNFYGSDGITLLASILTRDDCPTLSFPDNTSPNQNEDEMSHASIWFEDYMDDGSYPNLHIETFSGNVSNSIAQITLRTQSDRHVTELDIQDDGIYALGALYCDERVYAMNSQVYISGDNNYAYLGDGTVGILRVAKSNGTVNVRNSSSEWTPLSRASGGTGVNAKKTGTMTLNTTNCTASTNYNAAWHNGIVATIQLGYFQLNSALATGSTIAVGTVPDGFRPATRIFANVSAGNASVSGFISAYISSDGSITLVNRSGTAISTSVTIGISATYCI